MVASFLVLAVSYKPRCACAARVTVVGFVCVSVCVCVCLLSHISPLERLFVLNHSTGNGGQKSCGVFSETASLRRSGTFCIVWLSMVGHFSSAENTYTHYSTTPCLHVVSSSYIHDIARYIAIYMYTAVAKMQSCSASDSSK